eukprot:EG_transcript_28921
MSTIFAHQWLFHMEETHWLSVLPLGHSHTLTVEFDCKYLQIGRQHPRRPCKGSAGRTESVALHRPPGPPWVFRYSAKFFAPPQERYASNSHCCPSSPLRNAIRPHCGQPPSCTAVCYPTRYDGRV